MVKAEEPVVVETVKQKLFKVLLKSGNDRIDKCAKSDCEKIVETYKGGGVTEYVCRVHDYRADVHRLKRVKDSKSGGIVEIYDYEE